jgi:hypothetical protein
MGKSIDEKPPEWSPLKPLALVPGSEPCGGVYVYIGQDVKPGDKGSNVLVYHWHTPTSDEPRWQASRCTNHDVIAVDPLHLEASLGCEDGCSNHGWIRDGRWTNA